MLKNSNKENFIKNKYILLLIMLLFHSCSQTPKETYKPLVPKIIFIHGFDGGQTEKKSNIINDLRTLFEEFPNYNPEIEFYQWHSKGGITKGFLRDVINMPKRWKSAVKYAKEKESKSFLKEIYKLEDEGRPYYIIGYSLGTKVIVEALALKNRKLHMLQGIYFIGAAISSKTKLNKRPLPKNFKIVNFYSPEDDKVLSRLYKVAEFETAGGSKGFQDTSSFINLRTQASHTNIRIPCSFLNMGYALGYLIAIKEGLQIKNVHCQIPQSNSIQQKWNNLIEDKNNKIVYQQNSCEKTRRYFRSVEKKLLFFTAEKEKSCDLTSLINIQKSIN